jgi:hypothetical protein
MTRVAGFSAVLRRSRCLPAAGPVTVPPEGIERRVALLGDVLREALPEG